MIRLGTFNVENLFNRAKVLNLSESSTAAHKLGIIDDLQEELRKPVYDKPKIIDLYRQVKDYIKLNVTRSDVGHRIIFRRNGGYIVTADGAKDWDGFVEFKREKFNDETSRNTAKVIREVDADIMCLIEVENRIVLKSFNTDRLNSRYRYNMLIDGNDNRGIDVCLYSKLELGGIRTNIFDRVGNSYTFSRDCLEVEARTENGQSIFILVNHFKSKSGGGDERRKRQAKKVNEILNERYDLGTQLVAVMGDLNDTPDSDPLSPLLGNPKLHDVLALQFPDRPEDRWTYHYDSNDQIDYILVSDPLRDKFHKAGVERRGIAEVEEHTDGAIKPFPTVTNWRNAASDHAAVWADFDL